MHLLTLESNQIIYAESHTTQLQIYIRFLCSQVTRWRCNLVAKSFIVSDYENYQ